MKCFVILLQDLGQTIRESVEELSATMTGYSPFGQYSNIARASVALQRQDIGKENQASKRRLFVRTATAGRFLILAVVALACRFKACSSVYSKSSVVRGLSNASAHFNDVESQYHHQPSMIATRSCNLISSTLASPSPLDSIYLSYLYHLY